MESQICRKNEILYYNIHSKKLFDVIYQFSLRKHSAKAVSSDFLNTPNRVKRNTYRKTTSFTSYTHDLHTLPQAILPIKL